MGKVSNLVDADLDRQEYYKAYDRAVELVPSNLRSKADLTTSIIDPDGSVQLRDGRCRVLAVVTEEGAVRYPTKEAPTKPAVAPAPAQPATKYVTEKTFNRIIELLMNIVAERIEKTDGRLLEITKELRDSIAEMGPSTVTKALDAEAYDAMAEMAERLERLESSVAELADHGFHYRGYWRDGKSAKRNYAFTHNGSLWIAMRDTSDTPSNDSLDWNVIARKGRDGRDAR